MREIDDDGEALGGAAREEFRIQLQGQELAALRMDARASGVSAEELILRMVLERLLEHADKAMGDGGAVPCGPSTGSSTN